ncbi:MAG: MoxR family ATPase [Planctomycetaceae bacterium]|nr:MoxR family ATPase [Planctomycetaceae bacterium]
MAIPGVGVERNTAEKETAAPQTSGVQNSGAHTNGAPLDDAAVVARLRDARTRVTDEMGKVVVGQDEIIEFLLIGLLCRGHVLLHGVPGLGKTLMGKTLARTLDLDFRRIQFTPDLMPSDITGTDVMKEDQSTGRHSLEFLPGPIFTNFLLADEINRTPPKTQAALLQAMQEQEISIGRQTYTLKPPFYVVATQNPIEMEGTYPLPEAQVDRFMFSLKVKYPSIDEEVQIIKATTSTLTSSAQIVLHADEVLRLQELVRGVPIADSVVRYAARLSAASRPGEVAAIDGIHKYIAYGASPRASQFLVLGAKARAILGGKYHVDFADIKALAKPVFRHRLILNFHARADGVDTETVIERLLKAVPQEG